MGGFRIEGNTSGNLAEVTSGNEVRVALSQTPANTGGVRLFSENDDGSDTGSAFLQSPETSKDFRLRVGLDTILLNETFNYSAQNSSSWASILTTQTMTFSTAGALLNASAITTITTGAMLKSYRRLPLFGAAALYGEITCLFTVVPVTNQVIEIGLFDVAAATTAALLDGVFFRINDGVMTGVACNAASETTTGTLTLPAFGEMHKYVVSVGERMARFWVDDVLVGSLPTPTANGAPMASGSAPLAVRVYNKGVAPATAQQVRVAKAIASIGDYNTNKSYASQMAGLGNMGIQGIGGMTQGSTANMANSAAPASATLSNTAAGYTTLGGQWQFAAVAGAETDYALFAYQVPAATAGVTGRTLHITGVSIDTFNTVVAVATTATVFQWSIGVGSTAVSLATAEGAAAKAPRRMPLGVQSFAVAAPVGAVAVSVVANFEPIVANAGEFVHIILKMPIGTATATEIFRGVCRIESYWE
jgi:hypothetical protein